MPHAQHACELLPYQEEAVDWCMKHESSCAILAYDMGLGKTVITCALLSRKPQKTLVIAPSCILQQWADELEKYTAHTAQKVMIYHGANRKQAAKHLEASDIIVTTSHVLANDIAYAQQSENSTIDLFLRSVKRWVIDEAHQLRNNKCKVFSMLYAYAPNVENKIFLTGTPVCNYATDVISLICLSNYAPYNDLRVWKHMRYNKRISLLAEIIENVLLRKTKASTIASQLPKCNVLSINLQMPVPGEQIRTYNQSMYDENILRRILRMRQSLNNHVHLSDSDTDHHEVAVKIAAVHKLIDEIPKTDKIIIFSYFTSLLTDLYDSMEVPNKTQHIHMYHGEMNVKSRNKTINTFKTNPESRILLINLRAGGCGLNLTEANHVILMEPYWNESEQDQAINRVYRMGQTKEMFVYRLQVENSIETWLRSLQKVKTSIFKMLVDREEITVEDVVEQKQVVCNLFRELIIKESS